MRGRWRRTVAPASVGAAALALSVAVAAAPWRAARPQEIPAPAAAAPATDGDASLYPQVSGEAALGLYAVGTYRATERARRGGDLFLFGEIAAGLHLSPHLSIQSVVKVEPIGERSPNAALRGFYAQAAFLQELRLDWRATDALQLYAGKFSAPFGRGFHDFPGILPPIRADEGYEVAEALGFGATWTVLADPRFGEHDLSAAVFTLDTTFLSSTAFTRRRCCEGEYERFARNTRAQGGPGNTGRLDNVAVALDGDRIPWLPDFAYHLAMVSRAPGRDGTAREWGYAVGLRYELRWGRDSRTRLFAEHVEFRNAGGRPRVEIGIEDDMIEVPLAERRRFTTLGVQHHEGSWRAAAVWQRDQRKRSLEALPAGQWVEVSLGRDLGGGFGFDLGWQHARIAQEDGRRGEAQAVLAVLRWRGGF
ncbi:hypothetical protein GCM10010964_40990 [Caldovatus sediminis]|uniref:Uncharacterized protein n=1 Tax=Caldovatus sediminis TaxID=2041189 RepID=A0A8J2ZFI1_9PROT|nr:hypothetical protein [Caldovatus sediminis]GGG49518.1 hypothetical protein GCM10010964_40990 [Caldovatus sediminis]